MNTSLRLIAALFALALAGTGAARAEQADRNQPTHWESDRATHDDLKQLTVLEGNVVITRGTFVLRAQRVEMRQDPEGFQYGIATGTPAVPATFRQKRDAVDEYMDGRGDRIDYDGKADEVTLTGHARMQRLQGATVADDVHGQVIIYNSREEKYAVSGGGETATPANPQGRVRGTIAPRGTAPASAAPQPNRGANAPLRSADTVDGAAKN